MQSMGYGAVVLAGGSARRLDGIDKPAIEIGGRSLLSRVLDAVVDAQARVVVGPRRPGLPDDVVTVREEPPGGGPVAALAAGLAALAAHDAAPAAHDAAPASRDGTVVVLAADLPFVTPATVRSLVAAVAPGVDGVVLVDEAGRRQLLCGAWRYAVLAARLREVPADGLAMRRLVDGLRIAEIRDADRASFDCDTDEDLRIARERHERT